MTIDLFSAMIGILAIIMAALVSYMVSKSNDSGMFITKQRQDWREYNREWINNITKLVMSFNLEDDILKKKDLYISIHANVKTLITKLNPIRDIKFKDYLISKTCLTEIRQESTLEINLDFVTFCMSKLLKDDWEQVKMSSSFFGSTPLFWIIYSLALSVYLVMELTKITTVDLFSFNQNPDFYINLAIFIITLLGLRVLHAALMHIEYFRYLVKKDIYSFHRKKDIIGLDDTIVTVLFLVMYIKISNIGEYNQCLSIAMFIFLIVVLLVTLIIRIISNSDDAKKALDFINYKQNQTSNKEK